MSVWAVQGLYRYIFIEPATQAVILVAKHGHCRVSFRRHMPETEAGAQESVQTVAKWCIVIYQFSFCFCFHFACCSGTEKVTVIKAKLATAIYDTVWRGTAFEICVCVWHCCKKGKASQWANCRRQIGMTM